MEARPLSSEEVSNLITRLKSVQDLCNAAIKRQFYAEWDDRPSWDIARLIPIPTVTRRIIKYLEAPEEARKEAFDEIIRCGPSPKSCCARCERVIIDKKDVAIRLDGKTVHDNCAEREEDEDEDWDDEDDEDDDPAF